MLVEFRVRNYLCFRDEQILTMSASSDDSLPNNLITPQESTKLRLLRSAVVYGANASGKTKLLDAIMFVRSFVLNSARRKPDDETGVEPFLLGETGTTAPSAFEVTFIKEGVRYQYGFVADTARVKQEYLYAAPHRRTVTYYERSWDDKTGKDSYYFGSSLKGQNSRIQDMTRENALFLSTAATFKHPMLSSVYNWFSANLSGVRATHANRPILVLKPGDDYHTGVRELLKLADLGISDYRVEEVASPTQKGTSPLSSQEEEADKIKWIKVEMLHTSLNQRVTALPIESESNGTCHVFMLGPYLFDALANGKVLVIDELDASVHPLLVHALVELFHNPAMNKNNAQLIFNTHDTTLLDNMLFRRDQIYFTEKGQDGAAHLYSLLEYSPRKGESLAKGYLQGRYGAIPFLGDPSSLLVPEDCR